MGHGAMEVLLLMEIAEDLHWLPILLIQSHTLLGAHLRTQRHQMHRIMDHLCTRNPTIREAFMVHRLVEVSIATVLHLPGLIMMIDTMVIRPTRTLRRVPTPPMLRITTGTMMLTPPTMIITVAMMAIPIRLRQMIATRIPSLACCSPRPQKRSTLMSLILQLNHTHLPPRHLSASLPMM